MGRARQGELLTGARPCELRDELVNVNCLVGARPCELRDELVRVNS